MLLVISAGRDVDFQPYRVPPVVAVMAQIWKVLHPSEDADMELMENDVFTACVGAVAFSVCSSCSSCSSSRHRLSPLRLTSQIRADCGGVSGLLGSQEGLRVPLYVQDVHALLLLVSCGSAARAVPVKPPLASVWAQTRSRQSERTLQWRASRSFRSSRT